MAASILIFSLVLMIVLSAGFYVINYRAAIHEIELDLQQLASG